MSLNKGKKLRWLPWIVGTAILAILSYAMREPLIRVVVAISIADAHLFTPPPPLTGESHLHRFWDEAQFYLDIAEFRLARERRVKQFKPELRPLLDEIGRRQAAGQGMQYSMHIYREIRWRMNFTPDIQTTEARIADLRQSINEPEEQKLAAQQQPTDGSWGLGLNAWYLKLYYSVEDGLDQPSPEIKYPLHFLDHINSPEKLSTQLDEARFDDFTKTGTVNREELDETFSAVARLLFRLHDVPYDFDPKLRTALNDYVNKWQNPETGFWGQWFIDREGRIWKMDDMAMTFHVVSDLNGQVNYLDRIAKHTLEIDSVNFPSGIRFNGHYENHLNWDAVKILRLAWPQLDEPTRAQARVEISRMLEWSLKNSYQNDGSFKMSELDDTAGDATMYGVNFLREVGYFNPKRRFWTTQDFPEAHEVHDKIESRLKTIGLSDPGMKAAWNTLHESD
jgi:hypothetical protein